MARKKTSRPQPRKVDPLAMYAALSSSRRFEEEEKVAVLLPVRIAFEAVSNGIYSDDDVCNLYTATCLSLKVTSPSDPMHQHCLNASEALLMAYERLTEDDVCVTFKKLQIAEILTTVEIYEALVEQIAPLKLLTLIEGIKIQTKNHSI
jgi:hypothetical protein